MNLCEKIIRTRKNFADPIPQATTLYIPARVSTALREQIRFPCSDR